MKVISRDHIRAGSADTPEVLKSDVGIKLQEFLHPLVIMTCCFFGEGGYIFLFRRENVEQSLHIADRGGISISCPSSISNPVVYHTSIQIVSLKLLSPLNHNNFIRPLIVWWCTFLYIYIFSSFFLEGGGGGGGLILSVNEGFCAASFSSLVLFCCFSNYYISLQFPNLSLLFLSCQERL